MRADERNTAIIFITKYEKSRTKAEVRKRNKNII